MKSHAYILWDDVNKTRSPTYTLGLLELNWITGNFLIDLVCLTSL